MRLKHLQGLLVDPNIFKQ